MVLKVWVIHGYMSPLDTFSPILLTCFDSLGFSIPQMIGYYIELMPVLALVACVVQLAHGVVVGERATEEECPS
jgi:hypothetical protein